MKFIFATIVIVGFSFGSPAQAEETVREAAHQMHEDARTAKTEVKQAVPHPRVRCNDGRSTFKRKGACRHNGGVRS